MINENLIKRLKEYFSSQEDIPLAFLFGSYAKERQFIESDIDIAIWLKNSFNWEKINKIWNEIVCIIKKDIDLLILNKAKPMVAWSALRGIPLKIGDYNFYLKFMLQVSSEAEDIQDFILDFSRWRKKIKNESIK